jgi:hypothetical protein
VDLLLERFLTRRSYYEGENIMVKDFLYPQTPIRFYFELGTGHKRRRVVAIGPDDRIAFIANVKNNNLESYKTVRFDNNSILRTDTGTIDGQQVRLFPYSEIWQVELEKQDEIDTIQEWLQTAGPEDLMNVEDSALALRDKVPTAWRSKFLVENRKRDILNHATFLSATELRRLTSFIKNLSVEKAASVVQEEDDHEPAQESRPTRAAAKVPNGSPVPVRQYIWPTVPGPVVAPVSVKPPEEYEKIALGIVFKYFRNKSEVWMSPYLHKLRAEIPELSEPERKSIISLLAQSGVIKIATRKGEMHDFTVFTMNWNHPLVQQTLH